MSNVRKNDEARMTNGLLASVRLLPARISVPYIRHSTFDISPAADQRDDLQPIAVGSCCSACERAGDQFEIHLDGDMLAPSSRARRAARRSIVPAASCRGSPLSEMLNAWCDLLNHGQSDDIPAE